MTNRLKMQPRKHEGTKRLVGLVFVVAFVLLGSVARADGQDLSVMPIARDGQVVVSFELSEGLTEDVRDAIQSGLATTFSYELELRRSTATWFDRTIAAVTMTATVRFDNLTRRYQMSRTLDGRVEDARPTEDQDAVRRWMTRDRPVETRPVDFVDPFHPHARPPRQLVWIRTSGRLPDSLLLHQCVVAYASDMTLLDTATLPHAIAWNDRRFMMASLDHAMWFHRPFRADEWLLYAQESPSAHGARGFTMGHLFTRNGNLVVSVAQEGLIRPLGEAPRDG